MACGFAAAMGARPQGWEAERQRLIEALRPPAAVLNRQVRGAAERLVGGSTPAVAGGIAAIPVLGDIEMGEPEAVPAPAPIRGRIAVEEK